MPSRHISPQSFNDILSDLGDDPAIPDPQGIRKSNSPQSTFSGVPGQAQSRPKIDKPPPFLEIPRELKKWGAVLGLGLCIIGLAAAAWLAFNPTNSDPSPDIENLQTEIKGLQRDLANLRDDLLDMEDSLYESIQILEVSVHLLKKNKSENMMKPRVQAIPHEAEIRKWRYLGSSQMAGSQRAIFHNGKRSVMLEKGGTILGEWRLNSIDKELATITHPLGKSIILQTSKTE